MDVPPGSYKFTFAILDPEIYIGASDTGYLVVQESGTQPPLWDVQRLQDNSYHLKISGQEVTTDGFHVQGIHTEDIHGWTIDPIQELDDKSVVVNIHVKDEPSKLWNITQSDPGTIVGISRY
ncbi:hypothetical protein F5I97DRAFT_1927580 [Phlebopus sp. FC_14]|nr:hypothetical protein F5I97DRAFT_1927580 [Phlebopus sp. FC_14]